MSMSMEDAVRRIMTQGEQHESRLQMLEGTAIRDSDALDVIIRLNSIISGNLEERMGLMNTIAELRGKVEAQQQKIDQLTMYATHQDQMLKKQETEQQQLPPIAVKRSGSKKEDSSPKTQ